jgi:predicted GNAT superfamily acetyltransferase
MTTSGQAPAIAADGASADGAMLVADVAARVAEVQVRLIDELPDLADVTSLFDEIWRPSTDRPISTELMRAFAKAGNYVAGAYDADKLVGACVGFFAAPADAVLHSHIAGVSARVAGRHVGIALKLHQRAWSMQRGIARIEWTFDPLVARNAYFNIVKLCGTPVEYLPNFYGDMQDGINTGDDSDRLLVFWDLAAPRVVAACAGEYAGADAGVLRDAGAVTALTCDAHGAPVRPSTTVTGTALVGVPHSIETLRVTDPDLAREWRSALREVLAGLMAAGGRVTGFDRAGYYVIDFPERGTA